MRQAALRLLRPEQAAIPNQKQQSEVELVEEIEPQLSEEAEAVCADWNARRHHQEEVAITADVMEAEHDKEGAGQPTGVGAV